MHVLRAVLTVAALCIATTSTAQPQTGTLAGCVTDLYVAPIPLPGTAIELTDTNGVRHSTKADPSGCYELIGLAPGRYAFSATLPGFSRVRKDPVTIIQATVTRLEVKMQLGIVDGGCEVPAGAESLSAARSKPEFVVLHLRIVGREPDPPGFAFSGSIARYAARVVRIWNADPATFGTEISFLQFQAPGEQPYSPTEEPVLFLVWDEHQQLYIRVHDGNKDPMDFRLVDNRIVRNSCGRTHSIELEQLDRLTSRF